MKNVLTAARASCNSSLYVIECIGGNMGVGRIFPGKGNSGCFQEKPKRIFPGEAKSGEI